MFSKILKYIITLYQKTISPDTGIFVKLKIQNPSTCTFYPSCSEYTKEAINKYGPIKGLFKGLVRITRCHPWQKNHIDPLK